jgi:hypothetical protein
MAFKVALHGLLMAVHETYQVILTNCAWVARIKRIGNLAEQGWQHLA